MKKAQFLTFGLIAAVLMIFAGCGGGEKVVISPEEKRAAATVSNVPPEFETPNNNPDLIVGKGTAVSQDMQTAVNKANLQATNEIARAMNSKAVSLLENISRDDAENDDYESMYKETISQASSQVINGARESFRKIIPEGEKFRAYVIMELPLGKANKAILDSIKKNEELWRMFKDLEQVKEMERKVKEFEESQKQG